MARTVPASGPLALVIEADAALRHIMTLGLRQRGLRVLATPSLRIAWELLDEAPAIVVLDIGVGTSSEWMWPRLLRRHRLLRAAPLVLLAWECPLAEVATSPRHQSETPTRVCLAKPFDARALYAAVDGLLAGHDSATQTLSPPTDPVVPEIPVTAVPGAERANTPAEVSYAHATPGPLLTAEMAEPVVCAAPATPPGATTILGEEAAADHLAGALPTPESAPSVWPLLAAAAATLAVVGFLIRPVYAVVGIFLFILVALWWSTALVRPTPRV